ncbi:MAG: BrnT family toxin [Alphaproteobacteria bacterium]|nr:BrnT family toxin [Alphaproteobacteria bacterium]
MRFEWDEDKDAYNQKEHRVSFEEAMDAFADPDRLIVFDEKHSDTEKRWYCVGRVGSRVITVRFTVRESVIRIIGAAQWRKWKKEYETHKKQKQ